jgi:anti-sigma factor ChrR (cupin superfamily)
MKKFNLNDFRGGWFIGNFSPTILSSNDVECSIKKYKKGDSDPRHKHIIADEITIIITGKVSMNSVEYIADDIIHIEKEEMTNFIALEDTITCVIKIPCAIGDKYLV